jgi:hypothetical protein
MICQGHSRSVESDAQCSKTVMSEDSRRCLLRKQSYYMFLSLHRAELLNDLLLKSPLSPSY